MHKDIASKQAILAITEDIAHHLLNINIKEVEFVDKELKRIEKREADIVAKCKINNQTQILHLEIQNNNDNTMPRRMLRYYTDIKTQFKDLQINQHLIYIGKAKLNMVDTITEHNLKYHYNIVDMHNVDCKSLIELDTPDALVLSILCDFKGKNKLDVVTYLVSRLQILTQDDRHQLNKYLLMLETLSDNRNLKKELKEVQNMLRQINYENLPSYEIGMERGMERGVSQRNTQIAKNLLDLLDDKTIAIKTGLSVETVKSFRSNKH